MQGHGSRLPGARGACYIHAQPMALLSNSRNSLRFSLELATFESAPMLTRQQATEADQQEPKTEAPRSKLGLPILGPQALPQRLLASVSMDFFDKKDSEFWPFVRQAVLWLGPRDAHDLVEGVSRLVRDEVPGFAYRSSASDPMLRPSASARRPAEPAFSELALQIGKVQEPNLAQTLYAVEVGLDLATVLNEAAGTGNEPGEALSLFRFSTGRPQVVAFGQGLRDELAMLEGTERGEKSPAP